MSKFKPIVAALLLLTAPLLAESDVDRTNRELARLFGSRRVAETRPVKSSTSYVDALLRATNQERALNGLPPLRLNRKLSLAATDRVNDMFSKQYFDHVAPDGLEPFTWADKRGYRYRLIGENLAVGYRSAGAVVDGWMHSPGHRANILTTGFDEIGIAVANGSPARGYAGPLVVALYGAR